jgi:hypothetical protein
VPEPSMRLHPLTPDVKCPACGAGLTFVRMRGTGDLYHCASGQCGSQIMHYGNKQNKTCRFAAVYRSGAFGEWTACDMDAAKG